MRNLAKSVMLGVLLVPLAALTANNNNALHAYAAVEQMVIPTENESINVELSFPGFFPGDIATDNEEVTLDEPQQVVIVLRFIDPATGYTIEHVNYSFMVADESESMLVDRAGLYVQDGIDPHLVPFSEAGSFTLTVDIEGTGIDRPFDTTHSGTVSLVITVVPEFPLNATLAMTAMLAIMFVIFRFKGSNKSTDE